MLAPLIPQRVNTHPAGRRAVAPSARPDLRQWHILRAAYRLPVEGVATGICSGSTAHLRFQEWVSMPGYSGNYGGRDWKCYDELARSGLELAEHGWGTDQSGPGRGKKPEAPDKSHRPG